MVEIIKKFERFNWQHKLNALSPSEAKAFQIKEYRRASEDKEYWFRQYVMTIDARKEPAVLPFILYDFQIDLIKQLDKFMDTFIDKSRQMGISWTIMGWELHHALYTEAFTALNISRKESEVQDAGNTYHSLHGRIFFMYSRLPSYLKPRVYNPHLTFQVPSKNSIIKGESSNPKAGRDSQFKFVLIDEGAHIECLDEMWKGVRSATNSICLNSTPPKTKANNKFAEIKDMKNSGFKHMSFHWKQHPDYTKEWYAKKTASMTPEEIAQELEIAYDAALTDTSYPEYSDNVHLLSHKVYLNPKSILYCFQDYGLSGEVFIFAQMDLDKRLFVIYYKKYKNKLTKELYVLLLKDLVHIKYLNPGMNQDEIDELIPKIVFIGDKSGTKRSRTSKTSVIGEYQTISKGKISIKYKSNLLNEEKMRDMKAALKNRINGKPQINISKETTCLELAKCIRCLQLNKQKTDHVDNDYTHGVNAFEYGVSYLIPRKILKAAVASRDFGEIIEDRNPREVIDNHENIIRAASASAVIGARRIERKGVIIQ